MPRDNTLKNLIQGKFTTKCNIQTTPGTTLTPRLNHSIFFEVINLPGVCLGVCKQGPIKKELEKAAAQFFYKHRLQHIANSPNVICFSDVRLFRFILYMYTNFANIPRTFILYSPC